MSTALATRSTRGYSAGSTPSSALARHSNSAKTAISSRRTGPAPTLAKKEDKPTGGVVDTTQRALKRAAPFAAIGVIDGSPIGEKVEEVTGAPASVVAGAAAIGFLALPVAGAKTKVQIAEVVINDLSPIGGYAGGRKIGQWIGAKLRGGAATAGATGGTKTGAAPAASEPQAQPEEARASAAGAADQTEA